MPQISIAIQLIIISGLLCARSVGSNPQELVRVTAPRALSENSAPFDNSASLVRPGTMTTPPQTLAELLRQEPDVDFSGQGGLLQTFTIRGMGRQRVGSFYLDIPLLSERRAGTAASFIDPATIGVVELVRGPSSILHGFGAIGGLVRMQPRSFLGLNAGLGWGSAGDENLQFAAYGTPQAQIALSHRGANKSETASGTPLNTGFDQYNANLALEHDIGELTLGIDSVFSYAEDIGKSNIRYPDTAITDYPRERHWLGQISLENAGQWRSSLFFHAQDLETRVDSLDRQLNEVDNSAFDFGGKLVLFGGAKNSPLRFGLDYLGRRNVDADEKQTVYNPSSRTREQNLRAEQDDIAVFTDIEKSFGSMQWAAGLRVASTRQDARGFDDESETYANGFTGVEWFASDTLSFSLQASAGQRPANLSERYFSGTTGRGIVIGQPQLETENMGSLDFGTRWNGPSTTLKLHGFYTHLDDLIERVEVAPGVLSFRNSREGEIRGAEFDVQQALGNNWLLFAAGSYQDSEDKDGDPLQDTAANRLITAVQYQGEQWDLKLNYEYRFSRGDVALTEVPIDSARLLSARLQFRQSAQLTIGVWGRNLLNDEYQITTDDLSTEGEERAFGIQLTWEST